MALVLGLGDVHRPDQPPGGAVHARAVLARQILGDGPVGGQRVEAAVGGGADREQAEAMLAGGAGAGRRHLARHRNLHAGARIGAHLQPRLVQLEPVAVVGDFLAAQQRHQHVQRLVHHVALLGDRDAHHVGVRRERAGADPKHRPPAGHVVELVDPVGQHERVVVGQGRDPGAQPDVLGALGRRGDEHLGAGDQLIGRRVVLADPGLVIAELVQPLDQLQVALDRQRRVLVDRVERRDEGAEAQACGQHGFPPEG